MGTYIQIRNANEELVKIIVIAGHCSHTFKYISENLLGYICIF